MGPLFIPLKTAYYEAFERRVKRMEYRLYGPRWNERTCPVGRGVVLSKGYGRKHRMHGVIIEFWVSEFPWQLPGFVDCYGCVAGQRAACIRIEISPP